jgi:tetratricopeptide (TPR) repeat protein
MKTIKLKITCISIFICVLVLSAITISLVHAVQTISGIQRLEAGIADYENGKYDDAVFNLEKALDQISIEDNESLWKTHLYLGLSYCLTGDSDEARKQFSAAQGIIKNKSLDEHKYSPKIVKLFKEAKGKEKQKVQTPVTIPPRINLRSSYSKLSVSQVQSMSNISIREKKVWGFFGHSAINHIYEKKSINGNKVVLDHATGLMWHQSGSYFEMNWKEANKWVQNLNKEGYAGHKDWRLPTVEEAASLLESREKYGGLYIDSVFSNEQKWIWTGDKHSMLGTWYVCFYGGNVRWRSSLRYYVFHIRPVRSGIQ